MKVLKDNTIKKHTCVSCGSLLEVSARDIFCDVETYAGCMYISNYFYCPCCNSKNFVDDEHTKN